MIVPQGLGGIVNRKHALLAIIVVLIGGAAWAQTAGTRVGTVTYSRGGVIPFFSGAPGVHATLL